jgi:uncharacterized membrane protein YfcA
MMELAFDNILFACLASFLAGLIDAIVGGGGLIQLPALLILFPEAPIAALLGTNKLSSIAGTTTAIITYSKRVSIPWRLVLPASLVAFVTSGVGAKFATIFPPGHLKPVIFVLLALVLIYTLLRPKLGTNADVELHPKAAPRLRLASGVIGAYDGFLGPGTGNFLIFSLARWVQMPFLLATASAKVINWCTNCSAILLFALTGNIFLKLALAMASTNLLGGYIGARLAVANGNKFIRWIFLFVVSVLILKIGWDIEWR